MILNDSMPNYTGTYPGGVEKGISDGKIIDISDKMEEMAPNYYSLVENDPDVKQDVITDDGRLTRFYEIANKESDSWYGYMMREDWLKKIGYTVDGTTTGEVKIPKTYADWETVLQGFKDKGLSDTPFFLYSVGVDPFNSISAGFGVTFDFQLDETGKVNYGPYMDEFEDYLEKCIPGMKGDSSVPNMPLPRNMCPLPTPWAALTATVRTRRPNTEPSRRCIFI